MPQHISVLVFELHPYHTHNFNIYSELLPSLFRSDNIEIEYYVCPEVIVNLIYPEKKLLRRLFPSESSHALLSRCRLRTVYLMLLVKLISTVKKIDCIVFNTLDTKADIRIFRSIKSKLKIAVVHNPDTIELRREDNALYFCMNEYVFDEASESVPIDGYFLSYFRPVELPKKESRDGLIIGVPGSISFQRRNYEFLIDLCLTLKRQNHEKKIIFNIIGDLRDKNGPEFERLIEKNNIRRYFKTHKGIDDYQFSCEVSECDLLMPLMGGDNNRYLSVKNTATLSHSARYSKPLLLRPKDAECWGIPLDSCVTFNNSNDLVEQLLGMDSVDEGIIKNYIDFIDEKIAKNRKMLSDLGERKSLQSRFS